MTIVADLHKDHINLNRILDTLRAKVAKLRGGTRPNFRLMSEVIGYISDYADRHHHPIEDQMFDYFRGRDAQLDEVMQQCTDQHQKLHGLSHDLNDALEGILADTPMPMEAFIDKLDSYVMAQKAHLDFEESKIFPLMDQIAEEEDWEALDERLPKNEDPLFGENRSEQYVDLYRELLQDMRE